MTTSYFIYRMLASSLETRSFSLLRICSNSVSCELIKAHKMNILCPCLGLCGRGRHTLQYTDVVCDEHDMENKTQDVSVLSSLSPPLLLDS